MKVLSVKQPWAWLIVEGIKPIENRSWNTAHRGPLLIHASQEWDDFERGYSETQMLKHLCQSSNYPIEYEDLPKSEYISDPVDSVEGSIDYDAFKTGGIIGRVHVKDVVSPQEKRAKKETLGPFYNPGSFGWIMTKAERIPFTPAKGQLKLWEHEDPMVGGRTSEQQIGVF